MGGCATKPKVTVEAEAEAPLPLEEPPEAEERAAEAEAVAGSEPEQPDSSRSRSLSFLLKENEEISAPSETEIKDTPVVPEAETEVEAAEEATKQEPTIEPKPRATVVVHVDSSEATIEPSELPVTIVAHVDSSKAKIEPSELSATVVAPVELGSKAEEVVTAKAETPAALNGGSQQNGATYTDGGATNGSYMPSRKGRYRYSVALPLEVGTRVMCRWRDQKMHPVKVIERRKILSADPNEYEYYVHYTEFNRRLDEWVKLEQLDLDSVETDVDEKMEDKATSLKMTRHQKRKIDETHVEGHEELDAASLREHEEFTKVKNIAKIELGRYEIDTWYFSPFPPEYSDSVKLFFCEFCLNFLKRKEQLQRHMRKCQLKHPPGDEIYRSGTLSMFEVDGKKNKVYGQNLCYLAKLFLDHKTLYYDVDLFLFYILCECDERGCHMVGYFSKEKHSEEAYNLACILTLPPYQRKGYGKFLISFSYELSKKEGKVGTPERPLSDLGMLSYKGYWTRVLLDILKKHKSNISIKELSDMTAIKADDILNTLQGLDLIQYRKGQHVICADPKVLDRHLKAAGRGGLEVDVGKLIWTPYKDQG